MTKKEIIKAWKDFDDDAEVCYEDNELGICPVKFILDRKVWKIKTGIWDGLYSKKKVKGSKGKKVIVLSL